MAKLSSDKTYVIVEWGDTLSAIAKKYLGSASKYKQLAAINGISNPNRIYVDQKIKLTKSTGSGGSGSKKKSSNTSKASITHFGLQSNSDNTLFATWKWSKTHVDHYQTMWYYDTGNGHWFVGSDSTTKYKESIYSIPGNAKRVKFKVKPVSKKDKKIKKGKKTIECTHWTASWSTEKIYNVKSIPPEKPPAPSVSVVKFKLTAELDNIDVNATKIEFQVVKNDKSVLRTGTASIKTRHASFSCSVSAGFSYKVRCRGIRGKLKGQWSDYSSEVKTIPATPKAITTIRANSATEVYLAWSKSVTAESYEVLYAIKKEYLSSSNSSSNVTSGVNHIIVTGLESGQRYYFKVRAKNSEGESGWTGIKSIVIGKEPSAPTTWSSTTTAVVGEKVTFYWVHNSEDGSHQKAAEMEQKYGIGPTHSVKPLSVKTVGDDEEEPTNSCTLDTSGFTDGTHYEWRIRTKGILNEWSPWSIQRAIDIYAPPTLQLTVTDKDGAALETLTSFPFYISGLAEPKTQSPIGYHLTVTANEAYDTVDQIGNKKIVGEGEKVYSKYFDIKQPLLVEMSAGNIDLENNVSYRITCVVSMDSGLTAEAFVDIAVSWDDLEYEPNAEISFDEDTYAAYIRPYCENIEVTVYAVDVEADTYVKTDRTLDAVFGEILDGVMTVTGEQVYFGMTDEGEELHYCEVQTITLVPDITLSVYRREFDGTFTEIETGIENTKNTFVTDPHPSLDYARYRIVAVTKSTGAVSYYDVPGYLVGETSIIIQWKDQWSDFNVTDDGETEERPWPGSLLKLPYNIDVSDKHSSDVSLVEYIGRRHPVSYYGTQLGETASWKADIDKEDKDTLYALRRLAIWMGDVYVREPSGSGYWANITVSFSQTHCELVIPVSLEIVRVEGGM